jgi:hypothetical protein
LQNCPFAAAIGQVMDGDDLVFGAQPANQSAMFFGVEGSEVFEYIIYSSSIENEFQKQLSGLSSQIRNRCGERVSVFQSLSGILLSNKDQAQKGTYFTCLRDLFSGSLGLINSASKVSLMIRVACPALFLEILSLFRRLVFASCSFETYLRQAC